MPLQTKAVALLSLLGIVLIASLVYLIHTSAWFLWATLPEADVQVFLDRSGSVGPALDAAAEKYQFGEQLPFEALKSTRFVYGVSPGRRHVALVPEFGEFAQISADARREGWEVKRVGRLLIAQQSQVTTPLSASSSWQLFGQGLQGWISIWVNEGLPLKPVAAARLQSGSLPGISSPLRVIATQNRRKITFQLAREDAWPQAISAPDLFIGSPDVVASGPTTLLAGLPESLHQDWNQFLRTQFQFTHTRPDFMGDLAPFGQFLVVSTGSQTVVGAPYGFGQLAAQAQTWLGDEVAASRPVAQPFLLPDRTLGYEQRPGEAPSIFRPPNAETCTESNLTGTPFHLCRSGEHGLLGTGSSSLLPLQQALTQDSDTWYLELGPSRLSGLPGSPTRLQATGNTLTARLDLYLP